MTEHDIAQAAYIHAVDRCHSYEKLLNASLDDVVRHQIEIALNETGGHSRQALRRIAYLDGVLTHREYLADRKAFLADAVGPIKPGFSTRVFSLENFG